MLLNQSKVCKCGPDCKCDNCQCDKTQDESIKQDEAKKESPNKELLGSYNGKLTAKKISKHTFEVNKKSEKQNLLLS